jgi:hypothetical protein
MENQACGMIERTQAQSIPAQPQGKSMTTKPPRLPDPCTPEQAAEWLTHWSDETWNADAVLSQMFAVEAQSNETRIAYERGIVLVRIRPGTTLLRLNNGEWMPFVTVAAMHLEAETGASLAYIFKGGEHFDTHGGVINLDPTDDSFIGQLASLGHATPSLLVDRDGTRYHVTEPVQASDIRLRKDWVNELLSEFDRLAMDIERGEHPDIASMPDPIQNTDTPPAGKEEQTSQGAETDGGGTALGKAETPSFGLSKSQILAAPWGTLPGMKINLEAALSDQRAKWLADAIVPGQKGSQGGDSTRWNPAYIALGMETQSRGKTWKVEKNHLTRFIEKHFNAYLDKWNALCEYP